MWIHSSLKYLISQCESELSGHSSNPNPHTCLLKHLPHVLDTAAWDNLILILTEITLNLIFFPLS